MPPKTDFLSGLTHTGKVRENNEDAFLIERILQNRYILTCVIDGVGGYEGGEVAARIAKEAITGHLQKPSEDLFVAVREAVIIANERIYAEKMLSERNTRMACVLTLAVVDLTYNQFYYAHVGDTRLYLLRDYTLVKITRDDSFVGFLEDSKRITEEEAMNHPKRNEINKALGFDPNIGAINDYIETGISPFLPGDILLLCSDGLTDMINSKTITSILTSKQKIPQKAQALIDAANAAGGKDNVTVVLLHNTNKRASIEVTKPTLVKKKEIQPGNDEPDHDDDISPAPPPRSGRGLVLLLSVLCIILLGGVLWLFSQRPGTRSRPADPLPATILQRNEVEEQLQDSINQLSKITLSEGVMERTITISDTLLIAKDSIHIDGRGITLKSDSLFKGAGILVTPDAKYVMLENITFENFTRAIVSQGRSVQLKNIRFVNCTIPLEYDLRFPTGSYVTGNIRDTFSFKTDSIPK